MIRSVNDLKNSIKQGEFDLSLTQMHSAARLEESRKRLQKLLVNIEHEFSVSHAAIASAPGRTEIGGNHTDHNHGHVLAAAVNLDCLAVFAPAEDNKASIISDYSDRPILVDLADTEPRSGEEGTSEAIVRGVANGFIDRGFKIGGFKACISSTIPSGAGLSSSAAFEVLVGRIFNHLYNKSKIGPLDIARFAKKAENLHFGKPCGFMDQMACSYEGILSIDFNDPDNPEVTRVEPGFANTGSENGFYGTGYRLCVIDTGGSHADLTPDYAAIPQEMSNAAAALGREYGRGISLEEVLGQTAAIRQKSGDRAVLRLLHFIKEDIRALQEAEALHNGDMQMFLKLIAESGHSSSDLLQNCYSTSDPTNQPIPLALTVTELLLGKKGVARVHGGGFAGTVQAFVENASFNEYRRVMESIFGQDALIELAIRQPGNEFPTAGTTAKEGI